MDGGLRPRNPMERSTGVLSPSVFISRGGEQLWALQNHLIDYEEDDTTEKGLLPPRGQPAHAAGQGDMELSFSKSTGLSRSLQATWAQVTCHGDRPYLTLPDTRSQCPWP